MLIRLLPIVLTAITLTSSFTVMILGVAGVAQGQAALSINPFHAFVDVFPGQPGDSVLARRYYCPIRNYTGYWPNNEYCQLWLEAGPFTQVGVVIGDERVRRIEFTLRSEWLLLGDVMLRVGQPQDRLTPNYFSWANDALLVGGDRPPHYGAPFMRLRNISFTDLGWRLLSGND